MLDDALAAPRVPRALLLLLPLALVVALPASASAHGLVGRTSLPVPTWLFAWAAAAVLIVSFLALGTRWPVPRLERARSRRLFGVPRGLEPACGIAGVIAFVILVACGVGGSQLPTANLTPTFVFVVFWVGVPILSALFGDVFKPFSPWRAVARGLAWTHRRVSGARVAPPLPYPERLGRWPAVAGILAFAWLELVFVGREHPATLAVLAVAYALAQLVGMALFGIERWTERGDAFAAFFSLFARLSIFEEREGAVWARPPLSGLTGLAPLPGSVALVVVMIGSTTFDGFLNGPVWRSLAPSLQRDLGGGTAALEMTRTLGLLACILLCAALYAVGIRGMGAIRPRAAGSVELARDFVHTLVPIAFAYLVAHYFSLLVTQGQATASLISDPAGTGANLFGTAGVRIDYGLISAAAIWYVQVAALLSGHFSGLLLAHDRALVVYGERPTAAASQRWMLVVMVTFTCLGLWLLSAVNT